MSATGQPRPMPASEPVDAIPWAVRAGAAWAWRLLTIAAAVGVVGFLLKAVSEAVIPLVVATLLAAALHPVNQWLRRFLPRAGAAGITVLGTILVIVGLLALIASQFRGGFGDIGQELSHGIEQVRAWIRDTIHITDAEVNGYVKQLTDSLSSSQGLRSAAATAGLTATHFVAGTFVSLFTLFFFLFEGDRIWSWVVRLFPRTARPRVDSSGEIAFHQLTAYVRAQVLVALVDAVGITIGALILRVPFALAIGVLVFLFSFVPIVGAITSGAVAVLLALVAHGPVSALIMLAVVIAVQQLESHILQPFILGRSVSVHPVAVILSILVGGTVGGIMGVLIAVPVAAVVNAVGKHLAAGGAPVVDDDVPAGDGDSPGPDPSPVVPAG